MLPLLYLSQNLIKKFRVLHSLITWGVTLSSKFTWTEHIEYVSKKINQRLGLLRRIKSLLPRSASILFFNTLFLLIFDYADIVWEG